MNKILTNSENKRQEVKERLCHLTIFQPIRTAILISFQHKTTQPLESDFIQCLLFISWGKPGAFIWIKTISK